MYTIYQIFCIVIPKISVFVSKTLQMDDALQHLCICLRMLTAAFLFGTDLVNHKTNTTVYYFRWKIPASLKKNTRKFLSGFPT